MPRASNQSAIAAILVLLLLGGCRVVDEILPAPVPSTVEAPIIPPRAKLHPVPTRPVFSPAPPEELTRPLPAVAPLPAHSEDSGTPILAEPEFLPGIEGVRPRLLPTEDRTATFQWDPLPKPSSDIKSVLRQPKKTSMAAPSSEERGPSSVRFVR